METASQKVVVNMKDFTGSIQTILYDGFCPYTKKTEADYLADGCAIMTWEEFEPVHDKYLDSLCGNWKEITEEDYNDALNVLPPMRWSNGGFYMVERYTADVTSFYQKWYGKHYTSLQRLSYNRKDIIASLENFIKQAI